MKNKLKIKQSADGEVEIYIYGDIDEGYWWKDESNSAETIKEILIKNKNANVKVFVNSYGGDVMEAMAIRNQFIRHEGKVTAYVDGFACSAASFILTGCDEVVMYSNTMQMLHNMWTFAFGNHHELRKVADDLEEISEGNRKAYLAKANGKLTEEQLIEILDNETWLTAEKCLEYGLCDRIIKEEKDLEVANQLLQKFNQTLEQQISKNKALVALKQSEVTINAKDITEGNIAIKVEENTPKQDKENDLVLFFNKFKKGEN